jgi:antitoxin component YwqK of YwqJK toxin-antitoxin module
MRHFFIVLFFGLALSGCKTNLVNQKIDKKKEGVWIDDYTQDSIRYKSFEFYKHDEPARKWKSYINEKIYKTERYRNGISIVKCYYENGKVQSKGKTKTEGGSKEMHWFYFGEWKFYSDKGKLIEIKKYNKGKLISEQEIK